MEIELKHTWRDWYWRNFIGLIEALAAGYGLGWLKGRFSKRRKQRYLP